MRATETMTVRIRREVSEAIERAAERKGITRNQMLAELFEKTYIKEEKVK